MLNRMTAFAILATIAAGQVHAAEIPITSLDLSNMWQRYKKPVVDKSITGKPLSIAGKKFEHGLGSHASSRLLITLDGKAESFQGWVGVDDGAKAQASVEFKIYTDGLLAYESGIMRSGMKAQQVNLALDGVKLLVLQITDGGDDRTDDHADWADAKIITSGGKPSTIRTPDEPKIILTPKPGPEPRINAAAVYGCRPGHDFIYRVPATGARPMTYKADNLPEGISLDAVSGVMTGKAPAKGEYRVTLHASNNDGATSKSFSIKSGDTLALTPYMGWNHWYAYYTKPSDKIIRDAADTMVANGMADYGYSYIGIDDCWNRKPGSNDPAIAEPTRGPSGNMLTNAHFPDMKALTDYIHGKGLKAGIYTSPGPTTCAGFAGSLDFEAQDAKQFADWGFDLLKYDWCSYGEEVGSNPDLAARKKPYGLMGGLVGKQDRDIVFNLCQYGAGEVWRWGDEVGGQSWRTAGDLGKYLDVFINIAHDNAEHRAWSGPGMWNDPDYLQFGFIADHRDRSKLIPCPLTPNEQYTFMSLWCLMASPLVYSGVMDKLDDFALNIMCNSEVIEVDQDPLGQSGALADLGDDSFLLIKDMADGSKAVGMINGSETTATLKAQWGVLGLEGEQRVRDLWRQKDLGIFDGKIEAEVPRHGVKLVRIWKN